MGCDCGLGETWVSTMPSLIEDVLRIEREADGALAQAHTAVRAIEGRAEKDVAAIKQQIGEELDARLASFRAEAEARQLQSIEQAHRESAAALAEIARLDKSTLDNLAGRVADHFSGK